MGNIKRAQGCGPWTPSQEDATDQSASARRGLPSEGEARALHHQPRPSIDLDHALPQLEGSSTDVSTAQDGVRGAVMIEVTVDDLCDML
jgi:hypothetical protein